MFDWSDKPDPHLRPFLVQIWTANPRSQPIQPANCGIGVYAVVTIPGMDATQSGGVLEQGQ